MKVVLKMYDNFMRGLNTISIGTKYRAIVAYWIAILTIFGIWRYFAYGRVFNFSDFENIALKSC